MGRCDCSRSHSEFGFAGKPFRVLLSTGEKFEAVMDGIPCAFHVYCCVVVLWLLDRLKDEYIRATLLATRLT